MKLMTINAAHAPALRLLAEDRKTVGAVALGLPTLDLPPAGVLSQALGLSGLARVGSHQFALLASVPALPSPTAIATPPPKHLNYLQQRELQTVELQFVVREFVLPGIKLVWPGASDVVTGVEIVWAGKDFWDQVSDEKADTRKTAMAGVKLASKITGLYLGMNQAPAEALLTNQFAGLLIATADKVYSAKIKALDAA